MSRQPASDDVPSDRPFVLGTKLSPPPRRPDHIDRQRLFDRLDAATARPLTLVAAPTGFGKTTLLGDWARRARVRTAWITISAGDSDTVRLMAVITESLRRANALEDEDVDRELVSPGVDVVDQVLPRLLAAVEVSEPLVLILDDYHLLSGSPASDLLAAFIAQMPASLHVVIVTRADPRFPIGRLRASGALEEIRSDQLRFDGDEAARFLNGALGLDLDEISLATLAERTEGWPAGLYLAALTLRDRADRAHFVADFAGSSRHIVDYLSAEVLDGLATDDRTFLLAASVLSRLNGPLCDAVTAMPGSAARLRDLECANLFIVPLDDRGSWFRFHRLFAELLRSQLAATSPDLEPVLHLRAARWHAENGPAESAIEHAIAAGDRELAASLIVRSWNQFAMVGAFQTLERLIAEIGDAGRMARPLAIVEGLVAGLLGADPSVVRRLKAKAEAAGPPAGSTPEGDPTEALAAVLVASWFADDLAEQRTAAEDLMTRYPEGLGVLAGGGRVALGHVMLLEGAAVEALDVLRPIGLLPDARNLEMSAAASRSLATCDLGDPVQAEAMARSALARADGWGLSGSRVGGSLLLALGNALTAQGRPREAVPYLERALASWGVPGTLHRVHVLIVLASASAATGDASRGKAAAREARQVLEACPHAGALPQRLDAVERRLRVGVERTIAPGDRPSEAEMRVLHLLASPSTTREIAAQLYLSVNTVKTHVKALHQKLGTSSREATVAKARELGLL